MRLGVAVGAYVVVQISLARLQPVLGQASAKSFVAQPDAIRVHDVGLAVCGDLGENYFRPTFVNLFDVFKISPSRERFNAQRAERPWCAATRTLGQW